MRTLLLAGVASLALMGHSQATENYLYDAQGVPVISVPIAGDDIYDNNNKYVGTVMYIGGKTYIRINVTLPGTGAHQYVDFDQDPLVPPVKGFYDSTGEATYYTDPACVLIGSATATFYDTERFPVAGHLLNNSAVPVGSTTIYFARPPFLINQANAVKHGALTTPCVPIPPKYVYGGTPTSYSITAPLPWHLVSPLTDNGVPFSP